MSKAIGGYLELELRKGEHYHATAFRLNTARNCLEYIVRQRGYKHLFLPDYTCEVLLEPLVKMNVAYDFYPISERLEPASLPELRQDGAIVYTNYFGLKGDCVRRMAEQYGERLITDNAQAFFAKPMDGIDTFYSARKFLGVPDGAYLYTTAPTLEGLPQDVSWQRASHLLTRTDESAEAGFAAYQANNATLHGQDIRKMSQLTEAILEGVDYEEVKRVRRENYKQLHSALAASNRLQLDLPDEAVPMVYPYWTENKELRRKLQENRVYTATYWACVKQWTKQDDVAYRLTESMIAIPCDQRYGKEEMDKIISIIRTYE